MAQVIVITSLTRVSANALLHNPDKEKHWAELRLDQCFRSRLLAPSSAPQPALAAVRFVHQKLTPPPLYEGLEASGGTQGIKNYARSIALDE